MYSERRPDVAHVIAVSILAMTTALLVDVARADAKAVGFKSADTCAYAPFLIGGGSPVSRGGTLIDTREVDDRSGRVVGFYYVDDRGGRYLQATAFMDLATIERLGFYFRKGDVVSDVRPYDGRDIGLTIRTCRADHVESNLVVVNLDREMRAAFYNGFDVLPQSRHEYYLNRFAGARLGLPLPAATSSP